MKSVNLNQAITRDEIEQALEVFFARGGKIKILPEQKATSIQTLGENKWGMYEFLREMNF